MDITNIVHHHMCYPQEKLLFVIIAVCYNLCLLY